MKRKFENFAIIPAIATMMDRGRNFDETAQRKLVRNLLKKKVDGFYIGGATGEGFFMNPDERKKVISVTIEEIGGRVPMIAYTGSNDLKTAEELSRFAQKEGADAISSVRPYYGNFSYEMIKDYYTRLADSVDIPMLIYNNPNAQMSGMEEIMDLCDIENCCGIKYTLPNHYEMKLIKKKIGDKFVFSGVDEMIASAMISDVDGAIGSTYNVVPELFFDMRNAYENSDIAALSKDNEIDVKLINIMYRYSFMGSLKYLLERLRLGTRYLRIPNHTLTDGEAAALVSDLKKLKDEYDIMGMELFELL